MIVTFYSFKGGVGRSMALANVGEILADWGYRVLVCDWDLEAPGLERYVATTTGEVKAYEARPGLMDLLREYKETLAKSPADVERSVNEQLRDSSARLEDVYTRVKKLYLRRPSTYAVEAKTDRRRQGALFLLTAGLRAGEAYERYADEVRGFDWDEFYDKWAGDSYIEFFRNDMESVFDIVLVDSRTGVTEHGGVCTHHLADLVVILSTANEMNISGTQWMAQELDSLRLDEFRPDRPLSVLPVASRIELTAEKEKLVEFRKRFRQEFGRYSRKLNIPEEFFLDAEIPYLPFYSFEERVVAREDEKREEKLYAAYKVLTENIVGYGVRYKGLDEPRDGSEGIRLVTQEPHKRLKVREVQAALCVGREDRDEATAIIEGLSPTGVKVWSSSDPPNLQPGVSFVSQFEQLLAGSAVSLLLIGRRGFNSRARAELDYLLRHQTQNPQHRVIPVLLAGNNPAQLPALLSQFRPLQLPEVIRPDDEEFFYGLAAEISSDAAPARVSAPGSPFRGFAPFEEEHARFFFGRDREVKEVVELFGERPAAASRRWVQVEGGNGSGKSSLARAGVVPAVRRGLIQGAPKEWQVVTLSPGKDPLESLTIALHDPQVFASPSTVQSRLSDSRDGLRGVVAELTPHGGGFLLVLDQLETLLEADDDEARRHFDALVADALEDAQLPFYLLTTIRSDSVPRLDAMPRLNATLKSGASRYLLPTMTEPALRDSMTGAARMAGLTCEDGLAERVAGDAAEAEEPLAMFGHLLLGMWEKRTGDVLTHGGYQESGGLRGALLSEADQLFAKLDGAERERAHALLLSLVKIGTGSKVGPVPDDTRVTVTREEALRAAGGGAQAEKLLAWLEGPPRLLVIDAAGEHVKLLHEALVRHWSPLRALADAAREKLRRREELAAAERAAELKRQEQLAAELMTQKQFTASLLREKEVYDELKRQKEVDAEIKRRREAALKRRQTIITGFQVAALVVLFIALGLWQYYTRKQSLQSAAREVGAVGLAQVEDYFDLALLLNVAAYDADPESPTTRRSLFTTLTYSPNIERILRTRPDASGVNSVAVSPDGKLLWVGDDDGKVTVFNVGERRRLAEFKADAQRVNSLSYASTGDGVGLLACGGADHSVSLWRVPENERYEVLQEGISGSVNSVALSNDGKLLAYGGDDGAVTLWDVASKREIDKVQINRPTVAQSATTDAASSPVRIHSIAFSRDNKQLAVGTNFQQANGAEGTFPVYLLDTANLRKTTAAVKTGHTGAVFAVAFSPDGKWLASGSDDKTVRVWSVDPAEPTLPPVVLTGHDEQVNGVAFNAAGDKLISGGDDRKVIIWDLTNRSNPVSETMLGHGRSVRSVAFAGAERAFAVSGGDDRTAILWNVENPELLTGHTDSVQGVAFSPDSQTLASASSDGRIILWSTQERRQVGELTSADEPGGLSSIAFAPAANTTGQVFSPGWGGTTAEQGANTGRVKIRRRDGAATEQGVTVAAGTDNGSVLLWHVNGQDVSSKVLRGHTASVKALAFGDKGRLLASASSDKGVILWEPVSGDQPIRSFKPPSGAVISLAFNHDGTVLATGVSGRAPGDDANTTAPAPDGTIILWNVADGTQIGTPLTVQAAEVRAVAFSRDGLTLVTGDSNGTIIFWDVSGQKQMTERGRVQAVRGRAINTLAFSADGLTLASGGDDKTVRLWDVETRQQFGRALTGHDGAVNAVAFSPDDKYLVSAGADSRLVLRGTDPAALRQRACRIAARDIAEAEWRQYAGREGGPLESYRSVCAQ